MLDTRVLKDKVVLIHWLAKLDFMKALQAESPTDIWAVINV